ncbi:hypothetical protein [Rhizobium sp. BT03]|nr:hypothetical protein [Rhizobium sp. BT03]WHO74899.1 hypothetical protein QMO80_003983 [Rhizobium sp. BT03]
MTKEKLAVFSAVSGFMLSIGLIITALRLFEFDSGYNDGMAFLGQVSK